MASGEGEPTSVAESDLTPSTSMEIEDRETQVPDNHPTEAVCDSSTDVTGDRVPEVAVEHGDPTDAVSSSVEAEKKTTPSETPNKPPSQPTSRPAGKKTGRSVTEPPYELENHFIMRLPMEHACTVRNLIHSRSVPMRNKLKIDLHSDGRHGIVQIENVRLSAKMVDLPCVIGSLKTLDKKSFYQTGDISQMLVCNDGGVQPSPEEAVTSTNHSMTGTNNEEKKKKYAWKHGIAAPLKNVRKRRFRKVKKKVPDAKSAEEMSFFEELGTSPKNKGLNDSSSSSSQTLLQFIDSPEVEKEVKRLLFSDAEAINIRWEVVADEENKETEFQRCLSDSPVSPGTGDYKENYSLSEYERLRKMFSDSSSSSEDDDKCNKDEGDDDDELIEVEEEEDDGFEEDQERILRARILEVRKCERIEDTCELVLELQKQIYFKEKKLQRIQNKAERQKTIIRKVDNLPLKAHLHSVLEQLRLQEKERQNQLFFLQEQLRYFQKK
ncbi:PREDICTED: transcription initiation factor TFIID subunit 7-like [Dipodomys ordii]|uniref:Transcription initiation factor TFIID subunit 7-like n=1 Tax=Dipodomys ordii TaxID=10020 RepID=A0A1S3GRE1_DIPOR|nr:PREDICTED: transcription initiation factor TFIID subunit 7-like [Dipodomys ordii]